MKIPALIRTGKVSSRNLNAGTVRINFDDVENSVSCDLPMLNSEYKLPDIKESVVCIFLSNNPARGFCLGTYYQSADLLPYAGDGIFYKDFFGEAFVKYDRSTGTLTLHAPHVQIEQEEGGG